MNEKTWKQKFLEFDFFKWFYNGYQKFKELTTREFDFDVYYS